MLSLFFRQAACSAARQTALRRTILAHILLVAGTAHVLQLGPRTAPALAVFAQILVVAGIVEGAILAGWRLTQLPKSQALEFVLVSPLRPGRFFLGESLVGLARLGLVTLSGLPVLMILNAFGVLGPLDLAYLTVVPFTWGAITGIGLAVWAYEPLWVRRIGHHLLLLATLVYLVVGVLAGEKLRFWLLKLPEPLGEYTLHTILALHHHNPFGLSREWAEAGALAAWPRALAVQLGAMLLLALLLWRGASRLQGHFHDRHYRPAELADRNRGEIGERPLTWWAVKRVSEYSGSINVWLACGFSLLYAFRTVAGHAWPAWMGQSIFQLADQVLGVAGLATALVLLAAVPAAFQYGLWDSSVQERCQRLELLLLTELNAWDYWHAAAAAAWKRGCGYFVVALVLWGALLASGRAHVMQVLLAAWTGMLLWALYFALGFRAFSRGHHSNGLGLTLTLVVPTLTAVLYKLGCPELAVLTPPGAVYGATEPFFPAWVLGPTLMIGLVVWVVRDSLLTCDARLRQWYDNHHGHKAL